MSADDDLDGVLHRLITDDQVEQILSGRPVDGDPAYDAVARLLADARGDRHEAGQPDPGFIAHLAVLAGAEQVDSLPRQRRVGRIIGTKLATLAAAALLTTGVAVAAAIPETSNRAAVTVPVATTAAPEVPRGHNQAPGSTAPAGTSAVAESIGPSAASEPAEPTDAAEPSDTPNSTKPAGTPVGPDATGPAQYGLCTAFQARGGPAAQNQGTPVSFANLEAAAAAAGLTVEAFCAPVLEAKAAPGRSGEHRPTSPANGDAPGQSAEHRAAKPANSGNSANPEAPGQSPGHRAAKPGNTEIAGRS